MVIWRGLGGHTFKYVGKMPNSWTDSGPNLAHVCIFIWEWTSAKKINLSSLSGYLGGGGGVTH